MIEHKLVLLTYSPQFWFSFLMGQASLPLSNDNDAELHGHGLPLP